MTHPGLDVLLYAHDGRGLGHVSRSIGIGLALRRRCPELRVLLVTGCASTEEMIGGADLDWLKLPAYATEVVHGRSAGITGKSGYTDNHLGSVRARALAQLYDLYRPRVILCDHSPRGKHHELMALLQAAEKNCRLILGVRGIVGRVQQVLSSSSREVFRRHFHGVLWYGDSTVLGGDHLDRIGTFYGRVPVECGYVARLAELALLQEDSAGHRPEISATLSVPWYGEHTLHAVRGLAMALKERAGRYHLYRGTSWTNREHRAVDAAFADVASCQVRNFGTDYASSLLRSSNAVIYGGYNSLVDVLSLGLPSVVLLRSMADHEQQEHLDRLIGAGASLLAVEERAAGADMLAAMLDKVASLPRCRPAFNFDGADSAARQLIGHL